MKKRVRIPQSNPYYTNEPAVATSAIADKPPVLGNLANKPPKGVDKHPARMSGIGGFASKSKPPKSNVHMKVPKLGAAPLHPAGKVYRMAGSAGGHTIGGIKKIKGVR